MPPIVIRNALIRQPAIEGIVASLTTWSRLEALPATSDLRTSLQAPVADPLWFLVRQWQFNEFQGEDAGTPVEVRLTGEQARLARYLPGPLGDESAARAVDYQHQSLPLEVIVEREPVRATHARMAAEAGLHFLRLLAAEEAAPLADAYRAHYPLDLPAVKDPVADARGAAWQALLKGRSLDGRALAADLRPLAGPDYTFTTLPAQPAVPPTEVEAVKRAASRWLRWYDESFSEPAADVPAAWNPHRQEYALAVSAHFSDGPVVLTADEYTDGRLDWHSFRASDRPSLGEPAGSMGAEMLEFRPRMPVLVRYPGMPADRYWEFEDSRVYLAGLDAGPTDLARLLMVEFALVFGNDWFVIPIELPVGALFRVRQFLVRDTFGVQATVGPSRNLAGPRWTMFSLTPEPGAPESVRDLFFLPPTLPRRLEGDPVEEVALFRDEMANMVWAVERKVQGAAGEPYERRLEANRQAVQQHIGGDQIAAELIYRLMTPVPENWIPFVPVPAASNQPPNAFAIQLERRALLRTLPDGTRVEIHPQGRLLRSDLSLDVADEPPLRLEEEEVPREGIIVKRTFQFTRWLGGSRHLWLGRSKLVWKGEGSSGLRFDVADRK